MLRSIIPGLTALMLAACAPDYSPDVYSAGAVQQANKVETGVVIGYRQVRISAAGQIGTVTGGAAGGVLGSQSDAAGVPSALGVVGGTLVGGIVGTTVEHFTADTTGWEYIVRKPNGELLSVAQREPNPIPIGQKVLVITGNQARIVPDYAAANDRPPAADSKDKAEDKSPSPAAETPAAAIAPSTPVPEGGDAAAAPAEPERHDSNGNEDPMPL
jgi:outer membrane lipoprotein SlyB